MKKLKKILSLALIAAGCCGTSAHAITKGQPIRQAQLNLITKQIREIYSHFSYEDMLRADDTTAKFDRTHNCYNKNANCVYGLYHQAVKSGQKLNSRAIASYIYREMTVRGLISGYIQGFVNIHKWNPAYPSSHPVWHDAVIFPIQSEDAHIEWYVFDPDVYFSVKTLRKSNPDFDKTIQMFAFKDNMLIPWEEYRTRFLMAEEAALVRRDDCGYKIMNNNAMALAMNVTDGTYTCIPDYTFHVNVPDWMASVISTNSLTHTTGQKSLK